MNKAASSSTVASNISLLRRRGVRLGFMCAAMLAALASLSASASAANRFSVATGNWNSTSTWSATSGGASGASVPANGDVVTIEGGFTVTLNANSANLNSLTISSGSTLSATSGFTMSATTITVNGTYINGSTGTITVTTMNVNSGGLYRHAINNVNVPTATWNANSTLEVTGVTANNLGGSGQTFGNVTWNCAGQTGGRTFSPTSIAGNFTVSNSNNNQVQVNTTSLTIGGNFSQSGTSVTRIGSNNSRTWTVGGNVSITGGTLFLNDTGTGADTGTLNVAGDFTFTGGTIDENAAAAVDIVFNGSGTQTYTSGGTVSNTIDFTVNSGSTLAIASGSTVTVNTGATFTVDGTVSPAANALVAGAGTLTGTGTAQVTRTAATADFLSQYTITTTTLTNLTIDYAGAGAQTINATPIDATNYGDLVTSGSGTKTLGGAVTSNGNVVIGSGTTLDTSGSNFGITVGGNWTNNGGTFTPQSGTVTFNSGAAQAINGSATSQTFNNLTVNKGGGTLSVSGSTTTLTVNDLTETAGGFTAPATLNIAGNFSHAAGTFTAGTNTNLNGATQSFGGAAATTFVNLTTSNSGTKSPSGAYTVTGILTVGSGTTLDENTRTASLPGGASLVVNGTLDFTSSTGLMQSTSGTTTLTMGASGLIKTADSGGLGPGAGLSLVNNGGTWTTTSIDTNGTVEYYFTGSQTITDRNYNNLTITNTGTKTWTLTATTQTVNGNLTINASAPLSLGGTNRTLNVGGNWSNSGTFTAGTSTINFNSTTTGKTIAGTLTGTSKFNKLSFNGVGGAWSFSNPADVGSDFTITNGTVTAPSGNLNIGGNWSNSASFAHNSGTVTFNGTTNQSIGGSNSTTFATLAISNTGGGGSNVVSLATDQTVSTALNVTSGILDQGATFNLTSGAVTVSSGATLRNLGTGDLTLSGGVSNAGTITFDGGGGGCGVGGDPILIRSSSSGTQRAWSGTGTFSMSDVDVQDQAGTAIITVFSGTNSGNNGSNWVFINACGGSAGQTYVWIGPVGNDLWTNPLNWKVANSSPAVNRVTPAITDVLIFDGSTTPSPTASAVPTQTIAALRIINGAFPSFSTTAANTLTTDPGAGGLGFDVNNLNITGSNALTIKLNSGTGTVSGTMTVSGGGHRLISNNASAITFVSGANFTTSTLFSGNAFGTGSGGDGAAGSVIFASGAVYSHNAGSSPFGSSGNPSVVVFQSGSFARYFTATGFDASGRTYATLEIGKTDPGGIVVNATQSGTGNFQFTDLVINSPNGASSSSLEYVGSGSSTVTIGGNITSLGTVPGTLADVFLTAGTNIIINGGSGVSFGNASGNTRSIFFGSDATVNSGTNLHLSRLLQMGSGGTNVLTDNGTLTPNFLATGYIIGGVKKPGVPSSYTFPVGTPIGYTPVDLANATGGGTFTVTPRTPNQPVLSASTSLKEYWTLTLNSGTLLTDITFNYLQADVAGTEGNYRIIVVASGNATSFPADAEHIFDTTNNKFTVLQTDQFSDWTAGEPVSPTAVNLTSFTATRDGDEVMLQWHTGFEARNLGFNIYREENGQRTRITPSLVAGTALMTSRSTVLRAGQDYTWYDRRTEVRDQTSEIGSATYWLEDVDLNGTRTLHGPIAPAPGDSSAKQPRQMRAQLLNEVAQRAPASGVVLREGPQTLLAPQGASAAGSAQAARSAGTSGDADRLDDPEGPAQQKPEPGLSQLDIESMPGIKIAVSQEGWVRITQPELVAAGLDPNVNARKLQLYANAVQVPIKQSGDGNRLTAADSIEFYGHGLESTTETAQTYYLVVGKDAGLRIGVAGPQTISPPAGATNFNYTIERAERMIYFSGLLNGDAENFFGDVVSSDPLTQTLSVTNLDAGGAGATLEVTLQGVTNQAHQVRVRMNGADVGTMSFTGTSNYSQSFNLSGSAVHEGDNVVELTALGGGDDISLVDTVQLTYAHAYLADNNSLAISVNNGNTTRIGGFTNANIRVVDITNQANVIELTQASSISSQAGGTFAVDIQVTGASAGSPHTLLVFADGQVLHPDLIKRNNTSAWAKIRTGSDFLIITTGEFMASVEPLAQLRRQQGFSVSIVDVEDLYDEFSYGAHSPQAIQDFLESAMEWKRPPHYVLFAGDASYDPKNYFGQGNSDLVPTKLIDTLQMETASDDWFADFDGDGIADLAIGRLPARNAADAATMINKIVGYENAPPDPQRGAMLVADNTFESASNSVQSLLPPGMQVQVINRSSADDVTIHNQIIASLNQGPVIANYFGHGSNGVWTGASLLSNPDAATLTNQSRLSLFMMMTCFNGYFQDPYNDSLSEALLKAPAGAVAVWASTSLTEPDGQETIDQEMYRQLFSGSQPRLGDAVRFAKQATNDSDVRRTWTLFGDPTMKLKRAATQTNSAKAKETSPR